MKNIARPLRVYRVRTGSPESAPATTRPVAVTAIEGPMIAVLPFINLSGDPGQDYFSNGITEDIIIELGRFRSLFVSARNSSFSFKGSGASIQSIAEGLGVRYLVEGSVRKAADRVRINAQLTDAARGRQIWGEHYDREVNDIFAVQDEVTQNIVATLVGRVTAADIEQARRFPTDVPQAYDLVLRGQGIVAHSREANERARELYQQAAALDPRYAQAYLGLSTCHMLDWTSNWSDAPRKSLEESFACASKALDLDNTDSRIYARLGMLRLYRSEFAESQRLLERALALNRCDATALVHKARLEVALGSPDAAIERIASAVRLDPFHPTWYFWTLGQAQLMAGLLDDAIGTLRTAIVRDPRFITPHRHLAAAYALAGDEAAARREVAAILEFDPTYRLGRVGEREVFRNPDDLERYLAALRRAGVPD
ncbi:MAG TPA: tetratricopeptide repeat protein [Kiloniellales bacterium]|nr:tetratricopeptide repeat protein [Kiloniellales bacterium]